MGSSWEAFWGAGASARLLEGPASRSNWNRTAEPLATLEVTITAPLLRELGVTHLRIDLDWARIEPFAGRIDEAYLERVDERITELRNAGVIVWVSLHDDSLPGWFSDDTDGFSTPGAPSIHWSRHVDSMAERYDDLVHAWVPFIDPIGWAVKTAHLGELPPFRRSGTETDRFRDLVTGAVDALAEAHRLLASGSTTTVGAFALPTFTGPDSKRVFWERLFADTWIRALRDGVLEWPWRAAAERRDLADAFDAVALVAGDAYDVDETGQLHRPNSRPGSEVRLEGALHRLHEELDHPLVLMGLGVTTADDQDRSAYLERSLDQIASATADGVRVSGVFLEPFADTETTELGVVRRDGTPKPSFRWIEAQQ